MDDNGTDQDSQDSDAPDEGAGSTSTGDVDADGSRLDELGDRIQSVRAEAEESVEGVAEPEPEFHESGSEESKEADDQTAAPPG